MKRRGGPVSCLVIVVVGIAILAMNVYLFTPRAPRTAGELCGTYVLDCQLTRESVVLRADGTFTQTITIKATSEEIVSNGKWTYRLQTWRGVTSGVVTLDGFVKVLEWPDKLEKDYASARRWVAVMYAEYWLGQLIFPGGESWPDWRKVE